MKQANPDSLRKTVEKLSLDIGPRPIKRPEKLVETRNFIAESFKGLGMSVSLQPVIYKGVKYHNVLACKEGIDPLERHEGKTLVVGAHYDTVSSTPGADDNASGVAALIETASILSSCPFDNVVFASFCMEEPPVFRKRKMGSYWYAKHLKKIGQKLTGMICLEMVGYFSERPGSQKYPLPLMNRMYPDKGNFIAIVGNLKSKGFTLTLKKLFKKYSQIGVETLNAPAVVIGIDFSDHWAFHKMGYKAVMITDTAFYRNPNYHRPTDLPSTLDYKKAAQVVDGLAGSIRDLCSWA